jgi:hypothetical protein
MPRRRKERSDNMHFWLHIFAKRFSPAFTRLNLVIQVLAAVAVGAGLGAWIYAEIGSSGGVNLITCLACGAIVGLVASVCLVLKDFAAEPTDGIELSRHSVGDRKRGCDSKAGGTR